MCTARNGSIQEGTGNASGMGLGIEWNGGQARIRRSGSLPLTVQLDWHSKGKSKSKMHIPRQHKAPLVVAAQGLPKGLSLYTHICKYI